MNTQITYLQAARAMKIDLSALKQLLAECSAETENETLGDEQIIRLTQHLERRDDCNRRRAEENLETLVERCTPMIDTCALLHEQFPQFAGKLTPLLEKYGKTLIVPSGVVAELKRKAETETLREKAYNAIRILAQLKRRDLVRVYGEENADFGDKQFISIVAHFMTDMEMLVITQDNNLSHDLLSLNALRSVYGRRIRVSRINSYGYLSKYLTNEQRFAGSDSQSRTASASVSCELVSAENMSELIAPEDIPGEGERVSCGSGEVILGECISGGGEGLIYDLGDGTVAKVYRANKLTVGRRDKLKSMVEHPVMCDGVCWPRELLYTMRGEFIGYRMDKASGTELQRCLFTPTALKRNFPDWRKRETVQLCVTILEKIESLHRSGIVLGDINPLNILVESPEKVWFVDCDSYQIGGYPCPVGTARFTAPEIQKMSFSSFLRTQSHDAFAVATLLFMIMLPGKSPYAQQGGEDPGEAICAMQFPYSCGDNHSENTPEGAWRFLWSHLPRYLKEYFYGTFQKDGKYAAPGNRLSASTWLQAFRKYYGLLNDNVLEDPQSYELFPNRLKINDAAARTVYERCTCVECGREFDIMDSEREYYSKNALLLPKRCPTCRKLRRISRMSNQESA